MGRLQGCLKKIVSKRGSQPPLSLSVCGIDVTNYQYLLLIENDNFVFYNNFIFVFLLYKKDIYM